MEEMDANPSLILPGKIIVLVTTAGIMTMVETIWQKGISHDNKLLSEKVIDPLICIRFRIKVNEKNKARTIKPVFRYRLVLPVNKIIKKSQLKNKKVNRKAKTLTLFEKSGLPPDIKRNVSRSIGIIINKVFLKLPVVE